ncbi:MAG: hypothetical protein ACRDRZ_10290 [Pseudonocardiaceae bacterium]
MTRWCGRLVASRVEVTVVRDARLCLAAGRSWRRITARFREGLTPGFGAELERLARVREVYNRQRVAERLDPIEIVTHDRRRGACRIAAQIQPLPKPQHDRVEEIEFCVGQRQEARMLVHDLIGELIEANYHIGEVRRRLRDREDIEPLNVEMARNVDAVLARVLKEIVSAQKIIKSAQ